MFLYKKLLLMTFGTTLVQAKSPSLVPDWTVTHPHCEQSLSAHVFLRFEGDNSKNHEPFILI